MIVCFEDDNDIFIHVPWWCLSQLAELSSAISLPHPYCQSEGLLLGTIRLKEIVGVNPGWSLCGSFSQVTQATEITASGPWTHVSALRAEIEGVL